MATSKFASSVAVSALVLGVCASCTMPAATQEAEGTFGQKNPASTADSVDGGTDAGEDPRNPDAAIGSGNEDSGMPPPAVSGPCSSADTVRATSVRAYVDALPHGTAFTPLTADQIESASSAAKALLANDIPSAREAADAVGYRVVPLQTPSACLWTMEPTKLAPPGQGTFIVRSTYARDLILEAPHIPFDQDTDIEAAVVFDQANARGAIFAGAQRCALLVTSGCGANAACGPKSPVVSDAGHSVDTAFHAFHLAVATGAAMSTVVQFHSNVHPADNGSAMVTDGTRNPFAGSLAERIYKAVQKSTGADVRTCNIAATPAPGVALCGTDNTQGHASNGVADACTQLPATASGRFIHIEQDNNVLAKSDTWKNQIAAALIEAIPATH